MRNVRRRHLHFSVITALLCISVLLAGCGQKGPLYHPDGDASTVQPKS